MYFYCVWCSLFPIFIHVSVEQLQLIRFPHGARQWCVLVLYLIQFFQQECLSMQA